MQSATPIYDALVEEMLGPLTDFVPQWLIGRRAEHPRPPSETEPRRVIAPSEVHPPERPGRPSPPPSRHRVTQPGVRLTPTRRASQTAR